MPQLTGPIHPLLTSEELMLSALKLVHDGDAADRKTLLGALCSEEFLRRLDSEEAYLADGEYLNIERILANLASNPTAGIQQVLLKLVDDEVFLARGRRVAALIRASAVIKPPTKKLVRLWRDHFNRYDGYSPLTALALVENGHPAAVALFEQALAGDVHDESTRIAWMRVEVLEHRHDLPLLQACERLLRGKMKARLKAILVDCLFDYEHRWYGGATHFYPRVPSPANATAAVRVQLVTMADLALELVEMTPRRQGAIEKMVKALHSEGL